MTTVTQRSGLTARYPFLARAVAAVPRYLPVVQRSVFISAWTVGPMWAAFGLFVGIVHGGWDAHAYWLTGHEALTYSRAPGAWDAFEYSPLFADAVRPLAALPWPVFWVLWGGLEGAALWWLLRPVPVRWAIPVALLCVPELVMGNVYLLLAAAAVVGMRRPAAWLLPVLTKITPGVGLIWFLARGEWRRLFEAAATLTVLVGVSYYLQPAAWEAWLRMLTGGGGGLRDSVALFAVRCLIAAGIVVFAAASGRPWLIPVAMVVANPMAVLTSLTMLTAIPRLRALDVVPSSWSVPRPSRSTA